MQLSKLLISLPASLSCTVLQDWVDLKSLVLFDSACCARVLRDHVLSSGKLMFSPPVMLTKEISQWASRRGICLVAIELRGTVGIDLSVLGAHTAKILFTQPVTLAQLEQVLTMCPQLQSLGLRGLIHGIESRVLALCKHVSNLSLHRCILNDSDLLRIVSSFQFLHSLRLTECRNLTSASIVHIYTHCAERLHTLHLQSDIPAGTGPQFKHKTLDILFEKCGKIRNLHIHECAEAVQLITYVFKAPLPNIVVLYLSGETITNEALVSVAQYCKNVQQLSFALLNHEITFSHVEVKALISGCLKVQKVALGRPDIDLLMPEASMFELIVSTFYHWIVVKSTLSFEIDSEVERIRSVRKPAFDFFNVPK